MDSDEIKGKAPQADLDRMKRAINAVQLSNQKTLTDIGTTFGESVKNKAMIITTETEQKLRAEATKAASFTAFFAKQKELISTQNQRLNQLMAQNTQNIRRIKTRSKSL